MPIQWWLCQCMDWRMRMPTRNARKWFQPLTAWSKIHFDRSCRWHNRKEDSQLPIRGKWSNWPNWLRPVRDRIFEWKILWNRYYPMNDESMHTWKVSLTCPKQWMGKWQHNMPHKSRKPSKTWFWMFWHHSAGLFHRRGCRYVVKYVVPVGPSSQASMHRRRTSRKWGMRWTGRHRCTYDLCSIGSHICKPVPLRWNCIEMGFSKAKRKCTAGNLLHCTAHTCKWQLQSKHHIQLFAFEPQNGIVILCNRQRFGSNSEYKSSKQHQPKSVQNTAHRNNQLANHQNEHVNYCTESNTKNAAKNIYRRFW